MGRIALILLAVFVVVIVASSVVSVLVSALQFLFGVAVLAAVGAGVVWLVGGRRRRSRR